MRRWISRRTSSVLAATAALALLAPAVATAEQPDTTPTDDPVEAAAGWLATQLVDGEKMQTTFDGVDYDDAGLTADVVLALAGAGVAATQIEDATDWLETQASEYTGVAWDDVYAGATAKLALTLIATGRDTTVDDLDLIEQLLDREQDSGRFTDDGDADWSSTISQSLAVLALERAEGVAPSDAAITYLTDQQCENGGFPQQLDADECSPQVDATGFAVEALAAVGASDAVADAGGWLTDIQQDDGGFVGTEGTANANSTGLAAMALHAADLDDDADAARAFVLSLQDGCDGTEPGSIRYDFSDTPGVDRPRATSQALLGLTGAGLAAASADGASTVVPALDCREEADEAPDEPDETPAEDPSLTDVGPDNVHYDAIIELARRGVLLGYPDGTYRPANDLTRGQLASVLARAAGIDPAEGDRFSDVAGSPHEGAIYALADAGVIEGYPDGTYRPRASIRRDHVAALIGRWLEVEGVDEDRFVDLDATIHRTLINALADLDIARGDGAGNFHPHREVRRDQTASLVLRALQVLEDGTAG